MLLLDGLDNDTLASLLGVDRPEDFEDAEREHPDALTVVWPDAVTGQAAHKSLPLPLCIDALAMRDLPPRHWHGKASRVSRNAPVQWAALEDVAAASWKSTRERSIVALRRDAGPVPMAAGASACTSGTGPSQPSAAQVMRQRRSALAFDGRTSMPAHSFFALRAHTLPRVERSLGLRPMPWDVVPWAPAIDLALFVHRVENLAPGLYLLARDPTRVASLRRATYQEYAWSAPPGREDRLPLFLLQEADVRELAAQLSCGQQIAAEGAFSLAMVAEFGPRLRCHGAWFYRRLFWEAGLIGQLLYLQAQALGLGATEIGCFFDDPVHQVMGFDDATFQSLYYFAIGTPVEDPRLTTLPPYGGLAEDRPSRS